MPKHPTNYHRFPLTPTSFNPRSLQLFDSIYNLTSGIEQHPPSPKLREIDITFVFREEADESDDEGCPTICTLRVAQLLDTKSQCRRLKH